MSSWNANILLLDVKEVSTTGTASSNISVCLLTLRVLKSMNRKAPLEDAMPMPMPLFAFIFLDVLVES